MSAPPDRISELLHSMQSCISYVKAWATANMLKLNDNKTELMLVTSKGTMHLHNLPISNTIGNAQIPIKQSVKNLGFTLGCHLTMNAHIARTCYFELRRLASIRRFLTSTATATLVSAFVLSRIDHCNSLLFGFTHDVTSHYAARVILRLPKSSSITIHLKSLHWLPVKVWSTYKIACLCYHIIIIINFVRVNCYFCDDFSENKISAAKKEKLMMKEDFSTVNGALSILSSHIAKVLSAKIRLQLWKNIMLNAITQRSTLPSLMKFLIRHGWTKLNIWRNPFKTSRCFYSNKKDLELVTKLSFNLCKSMVENGKPLDDGEFIKNCLTIFTEYTCPDKKHLVEETSLSHLTVSRGKMIFQI